MKLEVRGDTLAIREISELGAENSQAFREQVNSTLSKDCRNIEVDLSQTDFLDSCGLGALISLRKTATRRNGTVRLLNPTPRVQLLFDVTRMHRIFEIVRTRAGESPSPAAEIPRRA
jgi:anti-sigma B factor antagonist